MATYVNDLRLKEIATGDESGTWGTSTNTNLSLIAEAFSYGTADFASDADDTFTIADGSTDPARSLYLKVGTSTTLTATRTLTLAPNTVSKVWIIENATAGSQSITISQGSGANVTIPNGDVKVIYTDGAGAGAAVVDAFTDLNLAGTTTVAALDAGSGAITTTGTVTGNTLAGTLTTAAQPNITSVGTLTALTGGTGDLNWDSGTLFVDSSANAVGIGTTSPADELHVNGSGDTSIRITTSSTSLEPKLVFVDGSGDYASLEKVNRDIKIKAFNTDVAYFTSNGNVGIGTSSPAKTLEVNAGTNTEMRIGTTTNGSLQLGHFANGTFIGTDSGTPAAADLVRLGTGGTERMRITSSGNVGIGTSSPTEKLDVNGGTVIKGSLTNGSGTGSALRMQHSSNISEILSLEPGVAWRELRLNASQQTFYIAGGEKMRIDSSGNVGIGTATAPGSNGKGLAIYTSDYPRLTFRNSTTGDGATDGTQFAAVGANFEIYNKEAGHIEIGTNNTERMRIDSSGRVGIGETSYVGALTIRGEVGQSFHAIDFTHNSSTVVGNVVTSASSTAYNTSSDYRLKENVRPIENGLERLNQLNPVKFDWKVDGTSSEGFIAHEAQEIFPDAVSGKKDGEKMQGMDYGRMTPLLVKAIQEQQVLIEQLQAEVALLKGE